MVLQTWGDVIVASLQEVWASVAAFIPLLIGAVVVFIVGWIVAAAMGKVMEQVVRALRVDHLLSKLDFEKALEKGGWKLNTGAFIGGLVKWFLIVVFLLAAANILGLSQGSDSDRGNRTGCGAGSRFRPCFWSWRKRCGGRNFVARKRGTEEITANFT